MKLGEILTDDLPEEIKKEIVKRFAEKYRRDLMLEWQRQNIKLPTF